MYIYANNREIGRTLNYKDLPIDSIKTHKMKWTKNYLYSLPSILIRYTGSVWDSVDVVTFIMTTFLRHIPGLRSVFSLFFVDPAER